MKKLGKITSFTLIIILIASLTVNFPYDATAQEFRFKIPSGPTLTGVGGVVVDSSGNVFASVVNNVIKFSPDGTVLLEFGSSGSGGGQFNFPLGIALDNSGNIYVADTSNSRVQKFNSAGVFQIMFGWGVNGGTTFETCTSGCQKGINGSGDGQFSLPSGIAVDVSGNIYVADTFNHRVQIFNSAGMLQSKFGANGGDGTSGSGDSQFITPRGIALDNAMPPNIYVADTNNHRVQKFNSVGVFQSMFGWGVNGGTTSETCTSGCQAGISGSVGGQFANPFDIAVDISGNIHVADRSNHRIQIFDSAGALQLLFGSFGFGDNQFNSPQGIALDSSGNIYVANTNNDRIQIFNSGGAFQSKFGSKGSGDSQFSFPESIALDVSGDIYVADTQNHRVQIFNSVGVHQLSFGTAGPGEGQFSFPQGIALDVSGDIYVADSSNHRVQIFDSAGALQLMFGFGVLDGTEVLQTCTSGCQAGISGFGDGQFEFPQGIAVDNSGNIYVVDSDNDRVQIFNSAGALQLMFGFGVLDGTEVLQTCTSGCQAGITGSGDGQFSFPEGIAVDSSGNIYVADSNNDRVQIFNSVGVHQLSFGLFGSGDGQFQGLHGIAVDSSGNIYVADFNNHRVQIFNPAGLFQSKFGLFGSGDGQVNSPRGIAVDSTGTNIHVADSNNNRIQKFNPSCSVPTMPVDMIIDEDCILSGIATAPANVIVQSGAIMIISSSATLDIDFVNNFLRIESGSGVLIKAGGKIT